MNQLAKQILADHLTLCQAQRESVNHMAAAESPDVLLGTAQEGAPLSAALIDLLYEAATEIANLSDAGNPVRARLLRAAKEMLTTPVNPDIIICDSCGGAIQVKDGLVDRCCRIERGDFDLEDRSRDNIKADVWLCSKCYLEDEALCGFFNRIGRRVR
jgi:hypothetical protein